MLSSPFFTVHKYPNTMAYAEPQCRNLAIFAMIHIIACNISFVIGAAKGDNSLLMRDSCQKRRNRLTTSSSAICPDGQDPILGGDISTCNRIGDSCAITHKKGFCYFIDAKDIGKDESKAACCPKCTNTASPVTFAPLSVCDTTDDCPAGFLCTSRDASGSILFSEPVCCPGLSRTLQEDDEDEEDHDEDDNPAIYSPATAAPVAIQCPDGQNPIPGNTYCGLGGVQCEIVHGNDAFCYIHPADAFAVCCPKCSNGAIGLSFCNATVDCPVGLVCTSRDASGTIPFAQSVCCPESDDTGSLHTSNPQSPPAPVVVPPPAQTGPPPTPAPILSTNPARSKTLAPIISLTSNLQSPDSITVQCPDGQNPLPGNTFCGRGGVRCETVHGNDAFCYIHPADAFAVCCPKCPNAATVLSSCTNTTDCSSGLVCVSEDASGTFSFTESVCCPGNSSIGSSGDDPTETPQASPSVASAAPQLPTAASGDGTSDVNQPDDFQIQCPSGQAPLPGNTFCGRGGTPCESVHGNDAFCYIDPRDRFAVCCPKCPGGDTGLSTCATSEDCPANTVCTNRDFSGGFTFETPVCCPPRESESANSSSAGLNRLSHGDIWMISGTLFSVLFMAVN